MSDLADIITRLEKATGPSERLNEMIRLALPDRPPCHVENYTGSFDDAVTLVPEGWAWSVHVGGCYATGRKLKPRAELAEPIQTDFGPGVGVRAQIEAATPILALCIAALKACQQLSALNLAQEKTS